MNALIVAGMVGLLLLATLGLAYWLGKKAEEELHQEGRADDAEAKARQMALPFPDRDTRVRSAWRRLREAAPKLYARVGSTRGPGEGDGP